MSINVFCKYLFIIDIHICRKLGPIFVGVENTEIDE